VPTVPGGHVVRGEDVPDPQVDEGVTCRTYTAEYKIEILAEYERLDKALGAVHRVQRCGEVEYPGSAAVRR
jgi:putative component of membrane protein insertase Oxa1/YidC/SpoIIIJ protein YidD